ncbi:MAG: hypothetical protein JSU07_04665 [Bacteroidetes bacterium]|nr:hypothetical protein [Bacteroidota bacterium]
MANVNDEDFQPQNSIESILLFTLLFIVIGFFVGYLIFGKIPYINTYIPLDIFFGITKQNILADILINTFIEPIRQKAWISTAIGGGLGILISFLRKNR